MKQVKKIINIIKKDKTNKKLVIYFLIVSLFIAIGFSLSAFTSNNLVGETNITVNGLSFNITTNGGASDDRVLHLKAGLTEEFNVILTNLNALDLKYELIYEICNNSSCTTTSSNIPSDITIFKSNDDTTDDVKGEIKPNVSNKKTIKIITTNNSTSDVYIKVGTNAGYEWNDLELKDKITKVFDKNKEIEMIAYVDGILVDDFPTTCNYTTEIKFYNSSNVATTPSETEASMTCSNSIWTLNNITTLPKKIVIKFELIPPARSFAEDLWSTIAYYAKTNPERYELGSKKCIALDGITTNNNNGCDDGMFAIRVANNTPCDASQTEANGFSQTTCGLVLEFADIINTHNMNPAGEYKGIQYNDGWSVDGWPSSNMYTYLNGVKNADGTWNRSNTLFSRLPEEVRKRIIDTYVVSGHGGSDQNDKRSDGNWESTDKLYLLSAGEIYKDCTTSNCYDTASYPYNGKGAVTTRQLGYYANYDNGESIERGVTTANYSGAIKQLNNANSWWWLRAATSNDNPLFRIVAHTGLLIDTYAVSGGGVCPAFRIG